MSESVTNPNERLRIFCDTIKKMNEPTGFDSQGLLQTLKELGVRDRIQGVYNSSESRGSTQTPLEVMVETAANGFWRMSGDTVYCIGDYSSTSYRMVQAPLKKVFKAFERRKNRLHLAISTS